jgi:hypothetical protein
MPHHFAESSLIYFSFSVVALYAPAVLLAFAAWFFFSRNKSRIERKQQQHRRIRERIANEGLGRRKRLALTTQRNNIRELAVLVRSQLEENKGRITPFMHQRTSVFIEKAVTDVDFDRLYTLYVFFSNTAQQRTAPVMEIFFEQER